MAARHTARRRRRRRRRAPCDRRLKAAQPAVSGLGEAAPQGGRRDEHAAGCRQGSDGHCPAQPGEFGLRNVSLKGFVLLTASTGEPYVLCVTCGHAQKDVQGRRWQCIPTTNRSRSREAGREGEIPRVPPAAIDLEGRWRLKAQARWQQLLERLRSVCFSLRNYRNIKPFLQL